jgi:ADP-ribose pyrophosphatase
MPQPDSQASKEFLEYLRLVNEEPALFANDAGRGYRICLDEGVIRDVQAAARQRMAKNGQPEVWGNIGVVFADPYIRILRDAVQFPDGTFGTYIRIINQVDLGDGVGVLPRLGGRIVLVYHFRHATGRWHLEIPRGFGAANEPPEMNARRELAEELGAEADRLVPLGAIHADSGLLGQKAQLFLAEIRSVHHRDVHEALEPAPQVTVEEMERLIASGEITDSFTIAAYTRARLDGFLGS